MPASSPSFPSERRGKWKRRKRGGLASRKPKQEEDDVEDEEEENNNRDEEDADIDNADEPQQNCQALPDQGPGVGEVLEDGGVRISDFPAVIRRSVVRPHASVRSVAAAERAAMAGESTRGQSSLPALENISYGQLQALSAVPADSPALDLQRSDEVPPAYVISPPPIMEGEGVVKTFGNRVLVVPMHSDWFTPNVVNRLERQVVPHYFSGKLPSHTPEKYMECRNSIVAKYMSNPDKALKVSDCKGLVNDVGDEDLARIIRFLDHWGIINYSATAENHLMPQNDISYVKEDTNGEIHVPSAALKSIESLIKFDSPKFRHKANAIHSSLSCSDGDSTDLDTKIREQICESTCNHCSAPLPTLYYQSQKEMDVLLCSECFHVGRFVIGHSSIDFVKVDPTKDYGNLDGENWSGQETLLLLEALELYNENWNKIAEHVGTKTKAQCILHFLQLPVGDGILENVDVPSISKSSDTSDGYGNDKPDSNGNFPDQVSDPAGELPFAKSANPVMALVAFLASAVGPRVAAACAHASLATLSEDDRMNSEGVHGRDVNSAHGESEQQKEEDSRTQRSSCQNGTEVTPLSTEKVTAAVKSGLSAAAMKAKLFADHEEREIQRLSANIINHQLKRMELKLKQFAEIETLLMKECEQVEKARQRFAAERSRFLSIGASLMNPPGIMINSNSNGSRQHHISASSTSTQPGVSGFGHNPQFLHPQMQFMQRQQPGGFSFGPRLPLNAIQTNAPSTAASNAMFGALGNSSSSNTPPSFGHPMARSSSGNSSGLN